MTIPTATLTGTAGRSLVRAIAQHAGGRRAGHADVLTFATESGRTLTVHLALGRRSMVELTVDRIHTGDRSEDATAAVRTVLAEHDAQDVSVGRNLTRASVPAAKAPTVLLHLLAAEGALTEVCR